MNEKARRFLRELLEIASPTGFEVAGQRKWSEYVSEFVDDVDSDTYGNTWASLKGDGDGHRLMLEAHADEIGLMINHISESGYLYVTRIGGSDRTIARGRRLQIIGSKGVVPGVVGNTAIHLRDTKEDKIPEWHEIFVDVGAKSREEVESLGLRVGHPAVYDEPVLELANGRLVARALDNRIGGFIVAQALQTLSDPSRRGNTTVLGVNAVQEEIGGYGARMITYRLEPSLAIVIDVTHATDSPGIPQEKHGRVLLGGGPAISHGTANHPQVVERLMQCAEAEDIPIQHEASSRSTGTDTDDVFVSRAGVPSALVSVPMRYMHSTVEMVDLEDVESCVRLLVAFARSIRRDDSFMARIIPAE